MITTKRLILRKPIATDVFAEVDFWQSERANIMGGKKTRAQLWRSFSALLGHWEMRGYGPFAVTLKTSGAYLGHIGPWYPEGWPGKEITWLLIEEAEGQSIAYEAANACLKHAYEDLGWNEAISVIEPINIRAVNLAMRLGAVNSGEKFENEGHVLDIYRHAKREDLH